MLLAHKIALDPTAEQRKLFAQSSGVRRFAYNWALAEWQRQKKAGEKPSEAALRRQLNAVKREQFPWMLDVSKCVIQQAIKDLGAGYKRAFKNVRENRKRGRKNPFGFPVFKKKGKCRDSFRADNGSIVNQETREPVSAVRIETNADGNFVHLPKIGTVRMFESLRFGGTVVKVVVSREANRWFAAFTVDCPCETLQVDQPDPTRPVHPDRVIGVDLGLTSMAVASDGRRWTAPKALKQNLRRLKRWSRALSRRVKGSANRAKAKRRVAGLHARIANIRKDALHQVTTALVSPTVKSGRIDQLSPQVIVLEDLNISGMMANRKLARAISDVGLYEFRRQVEYKAARRGIAVRFADRFFPSSKTCSTCGTVCALLPLSVRSWTCDVCLTTHDRDFNASLNLKQLETNLATPPATGRSPGRDVCGADGSGFEVHPRRHPAVLKQKIGT
jgi:putative transposase